MSDNINSAENNNQNTDDQPNSEERSWNTDLLAEKANNTFRELCQTLESEQTKLNELETRRKRLHEEMILLKAEIEEEKKLLNVNIVRSVTENLKTLNNTSNIHDKVPDQSQTVNENIKTNALYTCYEEEEQQPATTRNLTDDNNNEDIKKEESTIDEHVQHIRSELQNVLTQCISEQTAD